jgi:hypothetical protein
MTHNRMHNIKAEKNMPNSIRERERERYKRMEKKP